MGAPMAPVDRARPAQAAYEQHIEAGCRYWCSDCQALAREADAEDWKRREVAIATQRALDFGIAWG